MAFTIVMMEVTRQQMSAQHVLHNLGGGCVGVAINVLGRHPTVTISLSVKMEAMSCRVICQKTANSNLEPFLAKMAMDACGRNMSVMVNMIVLTAVMSLPAGVTTALANQGSGFAKTEFPV